MHTYDASAAPDFTTPRGVKTAAACGVIAAILAVICVTFVQNKYSSEARILPTESKASGSMGQLAAAAAAIGMSMPGADSGDANYIDILNSRSVTEDLLKTQYSFYARSWRFGAKRPCRESLYTYLNARNTDRAVLAARKIISVTKDLKTKIITVSAETKSPELSQQIVQEATKDLEDFVMNKGRTKGSQKARFAEARLKEARVEMAEAEADMRGFLEGNRNYQTSADATVRLTGARLEAELRLRQQLVVTIAMNRESALLEEKNDVPIVNMLDEANLPIDASGPHRALIGIGTFFLVTAGAWGCLNRKWVIGMMVNGPQNSDQ